MNERAMEIVTAAVTDAVVTALPKMIASALEPFEQRLAVLAGRLDTATDAVANCIRTTEAAERLAKGAESCARQVAEQLAGMTGEIVRHLDAELTRRIEALPAPPPGPQGEPGPPGRDGEFRGPVKWSAGAPYEKGTLVEHRNGLWVANARTALEPGSPSSGYALLVDGYMPDGVEVDEAGYPFLVFSQASGIRSRVALGFRPMQWRGVYDAQTQYEPNDVVTCEGSLWNARAPVKAWRPGTTEGATFWALIVKRGRDGKDGRDGAPGERGAPGECNCNACRKQRERAAQALEG